MVIEAALGAVSMTSMYPPAGTVPAVIEKTEEVSVFVERIALVLVLETRVLERTPVEVVVRTVIVVGLEAATTASATIAQSCAPDHVYPTARLVWVLVMTSYSSETCLEFPLVIDRMLVNPAPAVGTGAP
jgi:hypothetical protein